MHPGARRRQHARGLALAVHKQHIAIHILGGRQRRTEFERRGPSRHQCHGVPAGGIDDGVGIALGCVPLFLRQRGHHRARCVQHRVAGVARQRGAPECLAHGIHAFVVLVRADQLAVRGDHHRPFGAIARGQRAAFLDEDIFQHRIENPLPVPVDHPVLAVGIGGDVQAMAEGLRNGDAGSAVPAFAGGRAVLFLVLDRGARGHAVRQVQGAHIVLERGADRIALAVDQQRTPVQRGHGQPDLDKVLHRVIARAHRHAAVLVDETPFALPLHGGQAVAEVAHRFENGLDRHAAVPVQKAPCMAAQGFVAGHSVDTFDGRRQQHRGASVGQVADAAVAEGIAAGDIVGGRIGAVRGFFQAIHMAGLRMHGQGRAQRGKGAGDLGGADHA
ncbi:hypothetical protein D3C72_1145630 [compost metagenome]